MAAGKSQPTVKLSGKKCFLCKTTGETIHVKNGEHEFAGVVCLKHLYALLKEWEPSKSDETSDPAANKNETEAAIPAKV